MVEAHELPGFRQTATPSGLFANAVEFAAPDELPAVPLRQLWIRGRFEPSVLADSATRSALWRQEYIADGLPMLGSDLIEPGRGKKIWQALASLNGTELLGIQKRSSLRKDDFARLVQVGIQQDLLFVLPAWAGPDEESRSSPQLYWTDSGILHQMLGLDELLLENWDTHQTEKQRADRERHRGKSWEGFALSTLLRAAGVRAIGRYWRAPTGEIDLILDWYSPRTTWAMEITLGRHHRLSDAFELGCHVTNADRALIVRQAEVGPLKLNVARSVRSSIEVMTLEQALREVLDGP